MELEKLIAKRFIARSDVKAQQSNDGGYRPVKAKFTMGDLARHLAGEATYGHYLLNSDDQVKFFAFDCDLKTTGSWDELPDLTTAPADADDAWLEAGTVRHEFNPREAWADRRHSSRDALKLQMRSLADMLASRIHSELGIDVVSAYSGNKGFHVYGLTGPISAKDAREAGQLVLASFGDMFTLAAAGGFYDVTGNEYGDFHNWSIELFPKQDHVEPGHYGNLLRLPLGKNRKNPADPTFFIDQRVAQATLAPHPDPIALLTSGNPWKD